MIYVHVPFCRSFCTYCGFYSEIACRGRETEAFEKYAGAVREEILSRRREIALTSGTATLYIGGGTPSVLPLSCLKTIVEAAREVSEAPFEEFTMEVNPEDVTEKGEEYLRGLISLGVNRISMGVQSLDDKVLRWMNRRHDAAGAERAFRMLREAGMDNISVDLIFGYEDARLENSLAIIEKWRPEHISAYQLSIEEDSALARMLRDGLFHETSDEECSRQYALLCKELSSAGYVHYEISNWALPGHEAVHNSAYWKRSPYVGIGPGAHSFSGHVRSWNASSLDLQERGSEILTDEEVREERIMLGLRTARGIEASLLDGKLAGDFLADGRLSLTPEGRLRIPESHFFVSDDIVSDLI